MALSKLKAQLLFAFLFLVFCIDFYNYQFFQLPYGIHEWSNAERLSLAFGYFDNGMHFFQPTTFNQESIGGIVGHEFPIQSYGAALLAQLLGRDSIVMSFRVINLLFFFSGLLSLFSLVFIRTKSFLFSLIAPVFFISSPMFVDYSGGFLPDPASASLVFASFYFLMSFVETYKRHDLVLTITILTVATLLKTSSIIYLAAVLLYILIHFIRNAKTKTASDWITFLALSAFSGFVIVAYYLYNGYLNEHYHATLFLNRPVPFKNLEDISMYFSYSFKHNWMGDYFTLPAYLFFVLIFAACLPGFRKDKKYKAHSLLGILFFSFLIPVFLLMGNQLHAHDYYIICMFFPLLAWLLIVSTIILYQKLGATNSFSMVKSSLIVGLLILYCFANFSSYQRLDLHNERIQKWTRVEWMKNGAEIMAELNIPKKERILILQEMPPNQGLLFFDRKGYVFYTDRWTDSSANPIIDLMKRHQLKIAVSDSKRVSQTESVNPQFYNQFDKIYNNQGATVLKLK